MQLIRIRPIDPTSPAELACVAQWMRATLIEVEGEETGTALYSMDWLLERVRWHLDASQVKATVLLAENEDQMLLGHTIVRQEQTEGMPPYGLVSTTYVIPAARRKGIADGLLKSGEAWFLGQGLTTAATCTSSTNVKLIRLYQKHGYQIVDSQVHETTGTVMVRLEKALECMAPLDEDSSIQSALGERMMVLYSDGTVPKAGDQVQIDGKYKGKILANLDTLSFLPGQEIFHDDLGGTGLLVDTDFGGEIYYPAEAADEFVLISREQAPDTNLFE